MELAKSIAAIPRLMEGKDEADRSERSEGIGLPADAKSGEGETPATTATPVGGSDGGNTEGNSPRRPRRRQGVRKPSPASGQTAVAGDAAPAPKTGGVLPATPEVASVDKGEASGASGGSTPTVSKAKATARAKAKRTAPKRTRVVKTKEMPPASPQVARETVDAFIASFCDDACEEVAQTKGLDLPTDEDFDEARNKYIGDRFLDGKFESVYELTEAAFGVWKSKVILGWSKQ